jgi:hypothetical protein
MRRIGERRKPADTSGVKAFFRRTPITSHKTATLDTCNAEVSAKHLSRTRRGREMDRRRHGEANVHKWVAVHLAGSVGARGAISRTPHTTRQLR